MENLKYIFKSLYSNQTIINGRKKKWYFALLFFIIGVFLPWIPVLSSGYTTDASTIVTNTVNYEVDKGIMELLEQDYFREITIDGGFNLEAIGDESKGYINTSNNSYTNELNGNNSEFDLAYGVYSDGYGDISAMPGAHFAPSSTSYVNAQGLATDIIQEFYFDAFTTPTSDLIDPSPNSSSTSSGVIYENNGLVTRLLVYIFPDLEVYASSENTQFLTNFIATVILNLDANSSAQYFPHSYLIITKDALALTIYPLKSARTNSSYASYTGQVKEGVKEADIVNGVNFYNYLSADTSNRQEVFTNLMTFLNTCARPSVIYSTWLNVAILVGSYCATALVASIFLIIFHKRKKSIYRDTNYWECIKESVTLLFTPALLAMAIGFMSFQYELIALIALGLIRVVWMHNKVCPPTAKDSKPLYQARE